MCSMWLPTVFGDITSRWPISLVDRTLAARRSTSTSRAVNPVTCPARRLPGGLRR
jgi:hypothetical protein